MRNLVFPIVLALFCACAPPAPAPSRSSSHSPPATPNDAPPLDWLDQDLPAPARALDITRRAMTSLREHDGFLPAISQVTDCYAGLNPASALDDRVYCLQLDALAHSIELGAPSAWQTADARYNDYFTAPRFSARQTQFAPPLAVGPNTARRKLAAIDALAGIDRQVMGEELARMQAQHRP